jgi:multidrug efflux pump subunit AcrB
MADAIEFIELGEMEDDDATVAEGLATLAALAERYPKGLEARVVYDTTPFIEESKAEVLKTLRDAIILVALVVLLFLQNWRATLIPLVAVPVAIVGTFAFFINSMTRAASANELAFTAIFTMSASSLLSL